MSTEGRRDTDRVSEPFTRLERALTENLASLAKSRTDPDPDASFTAAMGALAAVAALHELHGKTGRGYSGLLAANGDAAELLRALCFAKNRVQHQAADVVTFRSGFTFSFSFPLVFFELVWKPADELPPAPKRHKDPVGEAAYHNKVLKGRPIRLSLGAARDFLLNVPQLTAHNWALAEMVHFRRSAHRIS